MGRQSAPVRPSLYPLIFATIADALQWIMEKNGVSNVFHYLDDFITLGPAGSSLCQKNLQGIISTCECTGTPLEVDKSQGPSPVLTFLGMELDTIKLEIRLPTDKLLCLKALLQHWEARRAGKKRDLLALIGFLQHAAKAVRQGRSFLRRLIDTSTAVQQLDGFIRLNVSARSDIKWWSAFASQWNGTSMLVRFSKQHGATHPYLCHQMLRAPGGVEHLKGTIGSSCNGHNQWTIATSPSKK